MVHVCVSYVIFIQLNIFVSLQLGHSVYSYVWHFLSWHISKTTCPKFMKVSTHVTVLWLIFAVITMQYVMYF